MIKKQGTILIVDDNRNILTTVRMLLEPIFDGIITIANPNSIPAKLREEHPDVVLLDMNFPAESIRETRDCTGSGKSRASARKPRWCSLPPMPTSNLP